MRKDIVKVNWSGGKDSSCAAHLHLAQGDECIIVNYIPMFTDKIPLILKEHYEFILRTADKFREMGGQVHILHGMTYWEYVTHIAKTGKNKGLPFGVPCFKRGQCGFKRDSKEKAISSFDKNFSIKYDYCDIGIAYDEKDRQAQLNEKKRSILVEKKITEADAALYCLRNGIYSPHYKKFKRDGCVLCANAPPAEREEWFRQYPESFSLLLELQDFVKRERPEQFPLRGYRWFIEEDLQMSLFDEPGKTKYLIN